MSVKCQKCGNEMELVTVKAVEVPFFMHMQAIICFSCAILSVITLVGGIIFGPIAVATYFIMKRPIKMWKCGTCTNWVFPRDYLNVSDWVNKNFAQEDTRLKDEDNPK